MVGGTLLHFLFNYVMDEEQLQQTPAFHVCAHLPITVDKPNSRIPACTICGGYLELRNIYRPSDVILNEHQQSAVKQYASDLLRMENYFHRKFNNDAERKRRQDSGEPTRGSLGSLPELEDMIFKLLRKGAKGGCVVMVHDTYEDKYYARLTSR